MEPACPTIKFDEIPRPTNPVGLIFFVVLFGGVHSIFKAILRLYDHDDSVTVCRMTNVKIKLSKM